ncbi:MAG: hypothetical protein HRU13_00610 [Phycisphaerales bacterium]|nr:hypothetical protein [Phycisphaerales bacterium]
MELLSNLLATAPDGVLSRLFALRELGFGQDGVTLGFDRPLPAWGWLCVFVACAALGWWGYRRLEGPRAARVSLAGVRGLTLLLLVVLVCGPRLERTNERLEPDWVVVLVDRSVSMRVADAPIASDGAGRATRDDQARAILERHAPMFTALAEDREVVWLGFDSAAFDLRAGGASQEGGPPELPLAEGRRTALGASLTRALTRAAAHPLSAVVIISDGRSFDEPSTAAMRRLVGERVPVHVVPLGSPQAASDVAIVRAVAPEAAFARDQVPVRVRLDRRGPETGSSGTLVLEDRGTGQVLDETRLDAGDPRWQGDEADATLVAQELEAGEADWVVRFVPDAADLLPENDTANLRVRVVDRPLRVLLIDGTPRWERRYLTSMLLREPSVRSSSLLLAARRSFIEEGNVTIGFPPTTDEGWAEYDVVIMGDVRAGLFSAEQLDQLREHVASRGAGLLWIGGMGHTPASWRGTPLEDLLPFRLDQGTGVASTSNPVVIDRTVAGERLGMLRLDESLGEWPAYLSDPQTGWNRLWWSQRIDDAALKPTAEVLAEFVAAEGASARSPAVLTMPYGAGRVVYVATDEIWRYRYGRGEPLFERFYLPLVRMQARGRLARTGAEAALSVSPRPVLVERAARVEVRLLDQSLVDQRLPAVRVSVRRLGDASQVAPAQAITLGIEDTGARRALSQGYAASWLPTEPGTYEVVVDEPLLAPLGLRQEVEVVADSDELRDPMADHALLASLADRTDGRVLDINTLEDLPTLLPRREVVLAGQPQLEPLWDRPVVLVILLVLLAAEWVGRRLIRLI